MSTTRTVSVYSVHKYFRRTHLRVTIAPVSDRPVAWTVCIPAPLSSRRYASEAWADVLQYLSGVPHVDSLPCHKKATSHANHTHPCKSSSFFAMPMPMAVWISSASKTGNASTRETPVRSIDFEHYALHKVTRKSLTTRPVCNNNNSPHLNSQYASKGSSRILTREMHLCDKPERRADVVALSLDIRTSNLVQIKCAQLLHALRLRSDRYVSNH